MQVTRLDTDMIALMVLLEKNRGSILKILVGIGMPLEDENAEWEEIVDFALQYIAEKKAVGFFLYKLSEIVLGITKTIYWTEAIAVRYLQYVQNKGLLKTRRDERRRGKKDFTIPMFSESSRGCRSCLAKYVDFSCARLFKHGSCSRMVTR